jgi:16S rRNA C1402 (ribose-2'-O) methylase RsmI
MDESILDRIPRLERSVRFWRGTSLILAAILVSVLAMGGLGFFGFAHQAARARQEALVRELEAREQAEVAAQAALIQAQALEEAKKKQRE